MVFNIIKYAGAGYLVYLGIKMFIDKSGLFENQNLIFEKIDFVQIYRQGLITNVLNPKVALFFLSFLPQFINTTNANGPVPFLILGATFMITGTLWCLFLAYSSSLMTKTLRNNVKIGKFMQKISGAIFIGLGLRLALQRNL